MSVGLMCDCPLPPLEGLKREDRGHDARLWRDGKTDCPNYAEDQERGGLCGFCRDAHALLAARRIEQYEADAARTDSLDAAYRERNAVVAALIRVGGYPAWITPAPDAEGWWIVYAETPEGQVSWHFGPDDLYLFGGIENRDPAPWDGHTTDEKYARVAALRGDSFDQDRLRKAIYSTAVGPSDCVTWGRIADIAAEYKRVADHER